MYTLCAFVFMIKYQRLKNTIHSILSNKNKNKILLIHQYNALVHYVNSRSNHSHFFWWLEEKLKYLVQYFYKKLQKNRSFEYFLNICRRNKYLKLSQKYTTFTFVNKQDDSKMHQNKYLSFSCMEIVSNRSLSIPN